MRKLAKGILVMGMVGALALSAGCGEDKKAPEKPAAQTTTTTEKTPDKAPEVKAEAPKDGTHYRYPSYIKDVKQTPAMTPEMIKYVDDFYDQIELHPSEKNKFLNDSKISNPNEKFHRLWFHAYGVNHDRKIKFNDSKGKERSQEEVFHIRMSTRADNNKVTSVEYSKFERNADNPDGKSTTIMKKTFD